MAEGEKQELLIIKRTRGGSHEPHGGAWKIAFADFMTAMMALFLVLWLINATNQKTKASLARYFNPVDLVDMSTLKRGIHDPNDGPEMDGAANGAAFPKTVVGAAKKNGSSMGSGLGAAGPRDVKQNEAGEPRTAEPPPTHSEQALFRDPYAVLAEIAASGSSGEASASDDLDQSDNDANGAGGDTYSDPFKAAAATDKSPAAASPGNPPPAARPVAAASPPPGNPPPAKMTPSAPPAASEMPPPAASTPAAVPRKAEVAKAQSLNNAQALAVDLQEQITKLIGPAGKDSARPAIEVKATDEGILISLTDRSDFAMFAIGSAEPQAKTVHVMDKIARVLKTVKGDIIIGGFTDGRPYRSALYDNWRLSSARAQMAYYMLVRGGVDEKRIVRIEGYADRRPKIPGKPLAAENRRIEIFLKAKKS